MLSLRSQRIQFCLYSSLVHRNDETWGGGQIEDSVLKLRPPPPSPSETLSLYGGQLDRIRRTLLADIASNCRPRCGDFSSRKLFSSNRSFSFLNRNTIAQPFLQEQQSSNIFKKQSRQ